MGDDGSKASGASTGAGAVSEKLTLASSVRAIKGVGPAKGAALLELGIKSVGQLIAYLPTRHEKLEAESTVDQIMPGALCSVRGTVTATRIAGRGPARMGGRGRPGGRFEAVLMDETGRLDLCWFGGAYLHGVIKPGTRLRVQGKAQHFGHTIQMVNPKHDVLPEQGEEPAASEERLRPIYPASADVSSGFLEQIIKQAMEACGHQIEDHLPEAFRKQRELVTLETAYRLMHMPKSEGEVIEARRRLAYDELFLLQLALCVRRHVTAASGQSPKLNWNEQIDKHIRERFSFTFTSSQDAVIKDIVRDLSGSVPASRLIQGDVGSGKTAVAIYALLVAVASRMQGALMAPTEILAQQHLATLRKVMEGSQVRVEGLFGAMSPAEKRRVLSELAAGKVDILVGTHALISEKVAFAKLAVAVIDEQHRFGVHQRLALRDKGISTQMDLVPHVIVMTATPIPRTVAMTVLGDLDVSVIEKGPAGRKKVITRVVTGIREGDSVAAPAEVYGFVRERLDSGDQAFIVAPAIESDVEDLANDAPILTGLAKGDDGEEEAGVKPPVVQAPLSRPVTIKEVFARLSNGPLAGRKLAMLHGQMPSDERDSIMQAFRRGEIEALVATTVIEVGVDVPNATVMLIEDAARFGLATLHQLRGRVGRGTKGGVCVLVGPPASAALGTAPTGPALERLAVMGQTSDGFKIAQKDLEIRGFGDVIGVRQSGMPPFRVVDLNRDVELLLLARRDAEAMTKEDPLLAKAERGLVRSRMLKSHGKWLGLADVG
jgi:ATP-dependent DNA helicase RecG